jgi:hypothetical protein
MTRTCPECGRALETVKRGMFRIECWPTHDARRVGQLPSANERNAYRLDHEEGGYSNQTDRCLNSGQPV